MVDEARALVASWSANAALWTRAVRDGLIASRRAATDAAILAAVRSAAPRKILDIGCGEGWLCRALADTGATIVGVDAAPELIAAATAAGGGTFHRLDYAGIIAAPARAGTGFDAIVCNFALLDDQADALLAAVAAIAAPGARLLIQTLHPLAAGPPDRDGWRTERFDAFGAGAWTEMPWYFRTPGSWMAALGDTWQLLALDEPRADPTAMPASLLLTAVLARGGPRVANVDP